MFKYQVTAKNAKGDFVNELFNCAEEADVRHKQLYHEVNERGLWKWGEIRTLNLQTQRDDTITGLFEMREEEFLQ